MYKEKWYTNSDLAGEDTIAINVPWDWVGQYVTITTHPYHKTLCYIFYGVCHMKYIIYYVDIIVYIL